MNSFEKRMKRVKEVFRKTAFYWKGEAHSCCKEEECVICNISYKELGVHPEPYENWTDGCPFCYEKSERLGDDE